MWFKPKSEHIRQAWSRINRADFLPEDQKNKSNLDQPLPIGFGQTISQPSVVAFMLELLAPKLGGKYLDVGSGSGWTTALLAEIAGEQGKVWAIEIVPEIKQFGQHNVSRYGFEAKGVVEFILGDGSRGYSAEAPFDGILVSASATELPLALKEQLKIGGRLVIPVGQEIYQIIRKGEKDFETNAFSGFVFVPLRSSYESKG